MAITTNATAITFSDATVQTTAAISAIPAGTVMLFYQAAAPTGWTQVTALDDYALRLVSGSGGSTGGTTAFSTVFANQTPTITTSGLSAGATTLSTAQMPSHNHDLIVWGGAAYTFTGAASTNSYQVTNTTSTSYAGGGGSHTHSISGSATSSAITLNVQYANIIICSRN